MVSKTPTKTPTKLKPSPKPKPKPIRRHQTHTLHRKSSPLKSLTAGAPAAAAAALRSCRRRLIKLFSLLAVQHKHGFQRLRSPSSLPASPTLPKPFNNLPLPPSSRKTLFLDLDETLVHSKTDPPPENYDFIVCPVIAGQIITFYVLKRPGIDDLFRVAAESSFEVVIFTAGLKEYASLVLDRLDPTGEFISHRLYRDACRETEPGRFVKDLTATGRKLDHVVIIDDNPNAYMLQPENAVPVKPFVDDLRDTELSKVSRFLEVASQFEDSREAIRYYLSDYTGN